MAERRETVQNLPRSTTTFIGREREMVETSALLSDPDCRLLTFVGPGGIGKTRLAIELASREADAFRNGLFFIPLAPLTSAENITSAVANSLGIQKG